MAAKEKWRKHVERRQHRAPTPAEYKAAAQHGFANHWWHRVPWWGFMVAGVAVLAAGTALYLGRPQTTAPAAKPVKVIKSVKSSEASKKAASSNEEKVGLPLRNIEAALAWIAEKVPEVDGAKTKWFRMDQYVIGGKTYYVVRGQHVGTSTGKSGAGSYDDLDYLIEADTGALVPDTSTRFQELLNQAHEELAEANSADATSTNPPADEELVDNASPWLELGAIEGLATEDAQTVSPKGAMTSEFSSNDSIWTWTSKNADGSVAYKGLITSFTETSTYHYRADFQSQNGGANFQMKVQRVDERAYTIDFNANGLHYFGLFDLN